MDRFRVRMMSAVSLRSSLPSGALALLLALLASWINLGSAADADILLEFAAATAQNYSLPGWNETNKANLCVNWFGIACNTNGRVIALVVNADKIAGKSLQGTIPPSLAGLTDLIVLSLNNHRLTGVLPPAIWSLPGLRGLSVQGCPLTVVFPPVVSQIMNSIYIGNTNVSGPMPTGINYAALEYLDFSRVGMRCPLAPGFIQAASRGLINPRCTVYFNYFPVDSEGLICGQVHVNNISCTVTPVLPPVPSFQAGYQLDPFTTKFADLGPYRLEFSDRNVFIFATYVNNRTKERVVYREEYFMFHAAPFANNRIDPLDITSEIGDRPVETFVLAGAPNVTKPDVNTVVGTALFSGGKLIFIFTCRYANGRLKYSTEVKNIGHTWMNATGAPFFLAPVVSAFRAAHSPSGATLQCESTFLSQNCVSTRGSSFAIEPDLSGSASISMTTRTASFKFSYNALNGTLDGVPFDFLNNKIELEFSSIFTPIGPINFVEQQQRINPNVDLRPGPDNEQVVYNILLGSVRVFNDSFFYDPEVSITLLFNPDDQVAPEAGASQETTNVTVIVAVVVSLVVVILGVTIFAFVVFPFLKRRKEEQAGQAATPIVSHREEEENQQNQPSDQRSKPGSSLQWSPAAPKDRKSAILEMEKNGVKTS